MADMSIDTRNTLSNLMGPGSVNEILARLNGTATGQALTGASLALTGALSCTTISGTALTVTSIAATGTVALTGHMTVTEAKNFILGTTTGTKIGTDAAEKLGFFNATPVVQRSAYTQTFATADKTHANPTATALGDLVATQNTGWGANSEAGFDSISTKFDALVVDVADVKALVNSVIDDLQALGLVA